MNECDASPREVWGILLDGPGKYDLERFRRFLDATDPPSFYEFAVAHLQPATVRGGLSEAGALLLSSGVIFAGIMRPEILPMDKATELARLAARLEPVFDARLLGWTLAADRDQYELAPEVMWRLLAILDEISTCERLVMPLMKCMRMDDPKLRSKAALLLARTVRNRGWALSVFKDQDDRVRANLVEGLGEQKPPLPAHVVSLLREACYDTTPRVAVNALVALAKAGDKASKDRLRALAKHPDERLRRSAAWGIKQIEEDVPG